MDRLFKTFSQVDSTTTRQHGGTSFACLRAFLVICDAKSTPFTQARDSAWQSPSRWPTCWAVMPGRAARSARAQPSRSPLSRRRTSTACRQSGASDLASRANVASKQCARLTFGACLRLRPAPALLTLCPSQLSSFFAAAPCAARLRSSACGSRLAESESSKADSAMAALRSLVAYRVFPCRTAPTYTEAMRRSNPEALVNSTYGPSLTLAPRTNIG
jgi:hypothetical protein